MNIRKTFPWIPIVGVPLTSIYHVKHGDTGIENTFTFLATAILQGVSCGLALVYLLIL